MTIIGRDISHFAQVLFLIPTEVIYPASSHTDAMSNRASTYRYFYNGIAPMNSLSQAEWTIQ